MATRLYFHNANNTNTGSFNQGQVYSTVQYGIAYGNGIYVRGNLTNVQVSTNGIDWGDPITVTATDIYGIAFGNGYFMVASTVGAVFRSTDGINWTSVKTAGTATVQNFVYRGSYWFLCCGTATLSIATGDGSSWTTGDLASFGVGSTYFNAAYNPNTGQYVVCGFSSKISFTTNPAGAWTTVSPPGAATLLGTVAWNDSNGLWIVGNDSTAATTSIYTTPTMSATPTWTARTVTGAAVGRTWCAIVSGSTTVLAGINAVTVSTDGTTWNNYNSTGLTPAMNSQTWFTGTHDGTYFYIMSSVGVVMRSSNGTSWSRVGGPLSNTVEFISQLPLATPPTTAYKLKSMNTTIGSAQSSLNLTTYASNALQNNFMGFFCSEPLLGNQTVGGGTMILNGADLESNLAANWWINGLCVYVWRPSTGSIVGYVRDYQGTSLGGTEPSALNSQQVTHITGITTSPVSAQSQDVIICEIWATVTQQMATAYTTSFYYDGTTENTTENAIVSNHASFVEFTENLTFGIQTPLTQGNMFMIF